MFNSVGKNGEPVSLQYRQACVFHDFCYRHGQATYGYSKADCDYLLQEYAYRLCRQIYGDDPGEEACRERGRVVLLGVNLFGGESFAHGYRSTYFEFDPYPHRANDYVVARLVKQPRLQRPEQQQTMNHSAQESTVWSLYFKSGWMIMKNYEYGSFSKGAIPFLREKVPVPPLVVQGLTIL